MILNPDAVKLTFVQAGKGLVLEDGRVHKKTVPYIIIAQAVTGYYEVEMNGNPPVKLKPKEAFLTAPDVPLTITHHCEAQSGKMYIRWVHLNFNIFNALELASLVSFPLCMEQSWADRIGKLSEEILLNQDSDTVQTLNSRVKINSIAFEILAILLDFLESKGLYPSFNNNMKRLFPALEYAKKNLTNRIEVRDMAQRAGLSVPRFHVEFKKFFKKTPIEYIRKLKLSKACDLLRSSNYSLEEIAMKTGFCNQFHFSREFKKFYNEPPSVYRQTMRYSFPLQKTSS